MIVEDAPIIDSGGAGRFRGGLGVRRAFKILHGRVTSCHRAERFSSSPWGVRGGRPGRRAQAYMLRADGRVEPVHAKQVLTLEQGDTVVVETAGGGGYGDPLERQPRFVQADVLNRKVSRDAALHVYGVVFKECSLTIDDEATQRQRARLAAVRGDVTWTLDRGEDGCL